jgi:hypothetical protein
MVELKEQYRQQRILEAQWRKLAREGGDFPAMIGPLRPRNKPELSDNDIINGDVTEPEGVWLTSIANPRDDIQGGRTFMARPSVAAHSIVFRGNFRLSTAEEIGAEQQRQQDLLNERIATGRNISRREDSRYGKRD